MTSIKAELKQDPGADSPFKVQKGDVKVESSEGTILFDREAGYVVSAREKFRIKGDNMTYEIMGKELDGAIDLTIESVTEQQPVGK